MDLKALAERIVYNTELKHYFGLFSYNEIVTLMENGATPTGGFQYSKKELQHEIDAGRGGDTYFYFKLNSGDEKNSGKKSLQKNCAN